MIIRLLEKMGFKRVLWLSFQEELIFQSALAFCKEKYDEQTYKWIEDIGFDEFVKMNNYSNYSGFFQMGFIKSDSFMPEGNVIMGSVMTVKNRLDKLHPEYFDCIVCDEAHLFASQSAVSILNYFKPKLLLGATATPHRADGLQLGNIFDKITFQYGLDKGIKDGWACEIDGIRVKSNCSLDKVKTVGGEFNQRDLSDEVNTLARNQLCVDSWIKYAKGRSTIAFCVDITHAIDLADTFQRNGINAVAVSSDEERTPNRAENIKKFKEGKIDVIVNVAILVAGFDYPNTGCALMACPTKSLTKYLQSVGRIARLKDEEYVSKFKQQAILIDIVDVTNKHNLINAWNLDRELPPEERVFITDEKRQKLLDARNKSTKLDFSRDKDEKVSLLKIPRVKISNSIKMTEPASEKQLQFLKSLGYDVENIHYTKLMCAEILDKLPASALQMLDVAKLGYDIADRVITRGEVNAIMWEVRQKLEKKTKT